MVRGWFWAGALFGAATLPIGVFVGLQMAPVLGSVLLAPVMLLVLLTGVPLGDMSAGLLSVAFLLSVVVWAGLFGVFGRFLKR